MYIDKTHLLEAFSEQELLELSNDDYPASKIQDAIVEKMIKRSCELINSYLSGRYDLPLKEAPSLITAVACDFTRYFLHGRRVNGSDFPEAVRRNFDNGMKILSQIRDGKIHLGVETTQKLMPEGGAYKVRAKKRMDLEAY